MTEARITWQFPEGQQHELTLNKELTIIGRGRDCDIVLLDERVSRQHTEIHFDGDAYLVSDLGSFNGTMINGELIGDTRPLENGAQLQIGPVLLRFAWAAVPEEEPGSTLVVPESDLLAFLETHDGTRFELKKEKNTIGRNQGWDICLGDRAVSRPHAEITRQGTSFTLTDSGSANGTVVNGQTITKPLALEDGDTILFGEHPLIFKIEKSQA
ncbi:MAG: FHA domain-containing protein [Anaerolineales bacterium]|nr:FHA domain-containing protein [Chloroflexota bacterium]MBL6980581.1 FHA domain-containing protein [Anaerolineales bacterium]